jgi:hypothetical protein
MVPGRRLRYSRRVKKTTWDGDRSIVSGQPAKLRTLEKCLGELQELNKESVTILDVLSVNPSAEVVRTLCARFHVLQGSFGKRYREARMLAWSALGYLRTSRSSP